MLPGRSTRPCRCVRPSLKLDYIPGARELYSCPARTPRSTKSEPSYRGSPKLLIQTDAEVGMSDAARFSATKPDDVHATPRHRGFQMGTFLPGVLAVPRRQRKKAASFYRCIATIQSGQAKRSVSLEETGAEDVSIEAVIPRERVFTLKSTAAHSFILGCRVTSYCTLGDGI